MYSSKSEQAGSFHIQKSVGVTAFVLIAGSLFYPPLMWFTVFWIGFSLSLILKEVARKWAAGKYGIQTHLIQVLPWGSVSQQEKESPHPTENFWIAMMGPISHIISALVLSFLGGLLVLVELDSPLLLGVFLELIFFNLLYSVIQILPLKGFDGYKIWRSVAFQRGLSKTHLRST